MDGFFWCEQWFLWCKSCFGFYICVASLLCRIYLFIFLCKGIWYLIFRAWFGSWMVRLKIPSSAAFRVCEWNNAKYKCENSCSLWPTLAYVVEANFQLFVCSCGKKKRGISLPMLWFKQAWNVFHLCIHLKEYHFHFLLASGLPKSSCSSLSKLCF